MVDEYEYFAPLSSPKAKHLNMKNNIDIVKIDVGWLGVVNFNNMIPVRKNNYELFDLKKIPLDTYELKRQNLLKSQLFWLNRNIKRVKGKVCNLYNKYKNNKLPDRLKSRCCNFILLEEKCNDYNS